MLRTARIACFALLTLPTLVLAQADDITVPAAACVKPVVPAIGASLDKAAAEKLNTSSTAYAACADAYLKARRATSGKYQAIANAHINASNAFAAEFNAYAAALDVFSKAQAAKTETKK